MINFKLTIPLFFGAFLMPASALADEIRAGVMVHDITVPWLPGFGAVEKSISVSSEYIWDTPAWLDWSLGARPYVYGSFNLDGNTHHGGVGLNWRQTITSGFYAEIGTGLSVHNGTKQVGFLPEAEFIALSREQRLIYYANQGFRYDNETEFGADVLFRAQIALGYEFNDQWGADIVYEHLSNGQILGGPQNDGLDSVGLRVKREF